MNLSQKQYELTNHLGNVLATATARPIHTHYEQMYTGVQPEVTTISDYYVVFDSNIESTLAKEFEKNNNVKVYAKLPNWFKIDTPLGSYNPDWAVLFELDGEEQLFFVVESKGSMGFEFLRPSEQGKIHCGKAHFKELASSSGSKLKLICVSNHDEFINQALS